MVAGSMSPSNSRKICSYDLPTTLARTFSRPRCAMPMHDLARCRRRPRRSSSASSIGIRRLGALEAEALVAHVLRVQEPLERLGRVQPLEDVALVLGRQRRGDALDPLLDPALLVGLLDVHVLDADRAAVGVAQHAEDLAQRQAAVRGRARSSDEELAVEVPDRQAVVAEVELGVRVEDLVRPSGSRLAMRWPRTRYMLMSWSTWACFSSCGRPRSRERLRVGRPPRRLVRDAAGWRTSRRRTRRSPSSSSCDPGAGTPRSRRPG